MHALIIEDEPLIAMAIEDVLRDCGCSSFDFARSAAAALAAAGRRCPDLITADIRLAPGCGIDAVEAICADKLTPVVFVTGTPADLQARLPGRPFVQKPFDAPRLAAAVRLAISAKDREKETNTASR